MLLGVTLAFTIGAYKTFAGRPFAAIVGALVLCAMAAWSSAAKQHRITGGTGARKFRRWLEQRWRWVLHVGDAFFVVAIVGLLYVDLPTDVAEVARRVRDADLTCKVPAVRAPLPGVHLDLIGVRAFPATFNAPYASALNGPRGSIDALYLGQANGFIMAYRPRNRRLAAAPSGRDHGRDQGRCA